MATTFLDFSRLTCVLGSVGAAGVKNSFVSSVDSGNVANFEGLA
jgi:hypothetical protein